MNPHAERLKIAMAKIRCRGCFERLEASDILIKTRRLLEDTKLQKSFPVVMLYADWCAHTRLDRIGAASVLLQMLVPGAARSEGCRIRRTLPSCCKYANCGFRKIPYRSLRCHAANLLILKKKIPIRRVIPSALSRIHTILI